MFESVLQNPERLVLLILIVVTVFLAFLAIQKDRALAKSQRALEAKEEERRVVAIVLGEVLRFSWPEWYQEGQTRNLKSGSAIWLSPGCLNLLKRKVSGGPACHGLPLDSATEEYLRERLMCEETF